MALLAAPVGLYTSHVLHCQGAPICCQVHTGRAACLPACHAVTVHERSRQARLNSVAALSTVAAAHEPRGSHLLLVYARPHLVLSHHMPRSSVNVKPV
jgi:hypothetical protein